MDKVKVNGENATNDGNVRLAIYGSGSVVIPNINNVLSEPLTLFAETDFGGGIDCQFPYFRFWKRNRNLHDVMSKLR